MLKVNVNNKKYNLYSKIYVYVVVGCVIMRVIEGVVT